MSCDDRTPTPGRKGSPTLRGPGNRLVGKRERHVAGHVSLCTSLSSSRRRRGATDALQNDWLTTGAVLIRKGHISFDRC